MKKGTIPFLPMYGLVVLMTLAICMSSPVSAAVITPTPGAYNISDSSGQQALAAQASSTSAGVGLVSSSGSSGNLNQQWQFNNIAGTANEIVSKSNDQALAQAANSSIPTLGARNSNDGTKQWQVDDAGHGEVTIKNVSSGKNLSRTSDGKLTLSDPDSAQSNQRWQLKSVVTN